MIPFTSVLLRLAVALLLGALIGLEREIREHTAGMRTNALVALGSALFTVISAFGFTELRDLPHTQIDPTRIASYIVAGIGFLGGGAIFVMQDRERVRGLTTAAAVWVVAAIGMACGAGLLLEAISATLLALATLILLRLIETNVISRRLPQRHVLQIEATKATGPLLGQIYALFQQHHAGIQRLDISDKQSEQGEKRAYIEIACDVKALEELATLVGELRELPAVQEVHADMQARKSQ